jgi:hypothetical protein
MIALALAVSVAAKQSRVLAQIEEERRATHRCQAALGVPLSPVSRMVPRGRKYQIWVLLLWRSRHEAYCAALRHVRRVYAYDEAPAARLWASSAAGHCVSSHEGAVDSNSGNGYFGKWQADVSFMLAYGREFYRRWGVASNWPEWAQDVMAHRGYRARGWGPWPNTAAACGVL